MPLHITVVRFDHEAVPSPAHREIRERRAASLDRDHRRRHHGRGRVCADHRGGPLAHRLVLRSTAVDAEAKKVTALLHDWRAGDRSALDQLVPIVYAELRKLAASFMRGERPGHTLRPTDLVSEAYLRLLGAPPSDFADRAHFFAIAGRTMRQILVDHARRRGRDKRGGGDRPVTIDEDAIATDRPEVLVALDDALVELESFDARKA